MVFERGVGQVEVERHGRGDWAKGEGALEGADKAPGTQSRGTGASEWGRGLRQPASPAPESVHPEAVVALSVLWGGRRGIRDLQTCDPFRLHVQPSTRPSLAVRDFRVAVGPSWVGHMCQINERSAPHHQPGSPAHDPSTTAQGAAQSRRAATLAWRGLRRPPGLGIRGSGGPGESPKGGRHGGKMSGENVRRKTHLCPLKWFESAEAPLQNASPRAGRGIGSGRRGLGLQTGQMRPTLLPSPPSKMSGENPQSLFA